MTHSRTTTLAFVLGGMLSACSVQDKSAAGSGGGDTGSSDGSNQGSDYSGSGPNSGGQDDSEEGADVLPTYPTAHPRIYLGTNKARLQASLAAHTGAATAFVAVVDRWTAGGDIWGFQAWNGALLGALTGDAKYCNKAISVVDAYVAAEEQKIAAGTQPTVAGNSYLEVGNVIGDLALTYDWCFDSVSASQKTRWLAYANQTVWNVWNPTQAKWGNTTRSWSGWSTNNPSDNYYYSFLRATMLLGLAAKGESPQADQWITQFRDTKVLGQLVPTFDDQLRGGGSREGTAYGVSQRGLFHLYDLWQATTGEKLQLKTKHARQSLRVGMHQVVPSLDKIAPTGDQPRDHEANFYDYQRNYLQELIDMYPSDVVAGRAKSLLAGSNLPQMARPEMMAFDFLYDNDGVTAAPLSDMPTDYHATGIGQVYSRSSWDKDATWINLTAGAYTESHAHQDQGALMIFKGSWLSADAVFASSNGIIQDTTAHSLVRINSGSSVIGQKVNTTSALAALHAGDGWLYMAADTTPAYASASVQKVQREVVFLKPNVLVVYDRVATSPGTTQTWQIATPTAPAVAATTATIAGRLNIQRLAPASARPAATSLAGTSVYTGGYRYDETVDGGDVRYVHVFSLDGAATSATLSGDSTVTVNLGSGGTATVAFNRDDIGATLTYGGATTTLAAGVDEMAE